MRRSTILLLPTILLVRILNAESTFTRQNLTEALTPSKTLQKSNEWLEVAWQVMIMVTSGILSEAIVERNSADYQAFHNSMNDIDNAEQANAQKQMELLRSVLARVLRISAIAVRKIDDEKKTFAERTLDELSLVIYSLVKAIVYHEFEIQKFLVTVVERFRTKMLEQIEGGMISAENRLKMTDKLGNAALYGLNSHLLSKEILDWNV